METNLNIPPFVAPCKAVCITKKHGWWDENNIQHPGPVYNEIVTIVAVNFSKELGGWFLYLKEYPTTDKDGYNAKLFVPPQESKLELVTLTKIMEKEKEKDQILITAN